MTFAPIAWLARLGLGSGTLLGVAGLVAAALANPAQMMALGLAVGVAKLRRGRRDPLTSGGTARFADHAALRRAGLLTDKGVILGRTGTPDRPSRGKAVRSIFDFRLRSDDAVRTFLAAMTRSKGQRGKFIRVRDYIHLATFAPTGKGKGQSVLKPNLLTFSGSVVVVDPDGELLRSVGDHRAQAFGHRNVVLAPFCIPGRPDLACDTLNPLGFLDAKALTFLDDCFKVASLIIVRTGQEKEEHFLNSAELVLSALIAFTVACEPDPEKRTFQVIRGICTSPDRFARTLDYMVAQGGVMARLGNQLKWFKDRELGSVMSTLQLMTKFLDSPLVAACTEKSSFDPEILRGNASVWLVLPSDRMGGGGGLNQLLRLWVGTILTRLTRDAADESRQVLFLIDEAANVGNIPQLEEAVTLMRKRGIRLWFFFQSLGQLSKCYGDRAGVFLDNIDTQQYFGLNAFESAEAISKRLGQETILVSSHNASSGSSRQHGGPGGPGNSGSNSGSGSTVSEQGRALMRPEEILLSDGVLVFHKNVPPILATLPLAHADPEFQPAAKIKPRPVGVSALVLSLGWLAGGASLFAWGSDQAKGLRIDRPAFRGVSLTVPASLQATAGRVWQAIRPDVPEEPILSEQEIGRRQQRAMQRADAEAEGKERLAQLYTRRDCPAELTPAAIGNEWRQAIVAAEWEAQRQRRRLAESRPDEY